MKVQENIEKINNGEAEVKELIKKPMDKKSKKKFAEGLKNLIETEKFLNFEPF